MKRIFGLLALGCLAACNPKPQQGQPKHGKKSVEPVVTQAQIEQSAVAQETPADAVTSSK